MDFVGSYFNLILVSLTILCTTIWVIDRLFWKQYASEYEMDWFVGYANELAPYLVAVLVIRSFIMESYVIPTESMLPQLDGGDYILVSRFSYGLRLPLSNQRIVGHGAPKRGDVVVFRYPENRHLNYIKRVIGVPGDKLSWVSGKLYINDKEVATVPVQSLDGVKLFNGAEYSLQILGNKTFTIRTVPYSNTLRYAEFLHASTNYGFRGDPAMIGLDRAEAERLDVTVPADKYFMMGDNRDESLDSRFWGFVPDSDIKGKAFYLWMHREKGSILPSFSKNKTVE